MLLAVGGALAWPGAAAAHTEFVGSDPANGSTVNGGLGVISLTFTNPASPAGDGFVIVGPTGEAVVPASIDPTDGTVFKLNFAPPLGDGAYTVTWHVRAGDAHPIEGTFTFTVTGSATTPTTALPATTLPATTPPASTLPATTLPATTLPATIPPATNPPTATSPATVPVDPAAATAGDAGNLGTTSTSDSAAAAGRIGRILAFGGTMVSLGVVIMLAFVLYPSRDELRTLIGWAQLGGLTIAVGGLVELAALREVAFTSFADLFGSKPGIAVLLKIVGGILLMVGLRAAEPPATGVATSEAPIDVHGIKWIPTPSAVGLAGGLIVLVSNAFDGHTASRGPWVFHAVINLVHVGAAAAWAGGIFTLALLAWMRRRSATGSSASAGVGTVIARFSTVATISLIALAIAGAAMALMITDGLGELFSTAWGKLLAAKIFVVLVAAGVGAYNRFTLVPMIDAQPADPALNARLRLTLTIEAGLLGVVVALTAWLVGAAV